MRMNWFYRLSWTLFSVKTSSVCFEEVEALHRYNVCSGVEEMLYVFKGMGSGSTNNLT